jgi:hypothetical protein
VSRFVCFLLALEILAAPKVGSAQNKTVTTGSSFWTGEKGLLRGGSLIQSTTDNVVHQMLGLEYRNHRREIFWPYPEEAAQAWDFGFGTEFHSGHTSWGTYIGRRAMASLGYKNDNVFYTNLSAGLHELNESSSSNGAPLFIGELQLFFIPVPGVNLSLKVSRDYLYQHWVQSGAISEQLIGTSGFLAIDYRIFERLRVNSRTLRVELSDHNLQWSHEFNVLYGLSPSSPWIWLGVGGQYVTFGEKRDSYWSPWRYVYGGPRLETSFQFFGKFSGAATISINAHQEDSATPGADYYLNTKLSWGARDTLQFDLGYTRIGSAPTPGTWSRDDFAVGLLSSF